eukprot:TRINITY_DN6585_c0_g1_i1.p1 TRINITY_DN6585_c0_g1~~TRINITY_DN6585_c0_g1_i1.p1  ORF type:complete len:329 (+),score=56.95 TRINITY_DN6585_c0_g1_i1:191-1177(+)
MADWQTTTTTLPPVPAPATSDVVVNSKRQRRPSVRLGDIGDLAPTYYPHSRNDYVRRKSQVAAGRWSGDGGSENHQQTNCELSGKFLKTIRRHPANFSGDEHEEGATGNFDLKDSVEACKGVPLAPPPVLINKRLRQQRRVRRRALGTVRARASPESNNDNRGFGGDVDDASYECFKDSDIDMDMDMETSGSPMTMKETCTIHLDSPTNPSADTTWDKLKDQSEKIKNVDFEDVPNDNRQDSLKSELDVKLHASSSAVQYLGMVKDVRDWLSGLGLGRYAEVFEEHEVDKEVLPLLTLDDLKEMGINAVGARRKMFSAIQKLGKKVPL